MLNQDIIEAYFKKIEDDGWKFTRRGDKDNPLWLATYKRDVIQRNVYVILEAKWIYFQLLLPHNVKAECEPALYHYLLRLNDKIFAAKFSLDAEKKIVLMAELPARNFDFTAFNDILRTMVTIADRYSREIDILAQDARLAAMVMSKS